jgi:hypothetical protein
MAGWLVLFGGSATSVAVFYLDHMNPSLWTDLEIGVVVSVVSGSVLLWLGRRLRRPRHS